MIAGARIYSLGNDSNTEVLISSCSDLILKMKQQLNLSNLSFHYPRLKAAYCEVFEQKQAKLTVHDSFSNPTILLSKRGIYMLPTPSTEVIASARISEMNSCERCFTCIVQQMQGALKCTPVRDASLHCAANARSSVNEFL